MEAPKSHVDRNRRLLDILTRRSVEHYNVFVECLAESGHEQIAGVLANKHGQPDTVDTH